MLESLSVWLNASGNQDSSFFSLFNLDGTMGVGNKTWRLPNFMASNVEVLEDVGQMLDVLGGTAGRVSLLELVLPESVDGESCCIRTA